MSSALNPPLPDLGGDRLGDEQLRLEGLRRLLDARSHVNHVSDDRVFLALGSADVSGRGLAGVKPDTDACGRNAALAIQLVQAPKNRERRPHGVGALIRVVERRAEDGHEAVAEKLVHDPMMLVHERNHEFEQNV